MSGNKMVTVHLFKGTGKYAGDAFVGVNGKGYQIKRGVDVQVPASVAEVLRHSEEQDNIAMARAEELAALINN